MLIFEHVQVVQSVWLRGWIPFFECIFEGKARCPLGQAVNVSHRVEGDVNRNCLGSAWFAICKGSEPLFPCSFGFILAFGMGMLQVEQLAIVEGGKRLAVLDKIYLEGTVPHLHGNLCIFQGHMVGLDLHVGPPGTFLFQVFHQHVFHLIPGLWFAHLKPHDSTFVGQNGDRERDVGFHLIPNGGFEAISHHPHVPAFDPVVMVCSYDPSVPLAEVRLLAGLELVVLERLSQDHQEGQGGRAP
mmetsp:Transcript_7160/g.44452  ORF Transcript_7160/g.44452 Transcript_7160/m.44452 type:complete len:243 (-) Transcript_7160:60-788(-)